MVKLRWLKEWKERKIGDISEAGTKSAENFVNEGFAEYLEDPIKEIEKKEAKVAEDTLYPEKEILKEELKLETLEAYTENEINWVDDDYLNSYDHIKGHLKSLWGHKKEYNEEEETKFLFVAHGNNTIRGKPQLIDQVKRRIPLVRKAIKTFKEGSGKEATETEIQSFYFFDEKFDKRHDGFQVDAFAMDFWIYRLVSEDHKEYYIWSEKEIPNKVCTFKGMSVELDDFAEMSRSMKIKSLSRIFFIKDFEPDVKIISPEELVKKTRELDLTEEKWNTYLNTHENGNLNDFVDDFKKIRSIQILSSKFDDYPLHLWVWGQAGTKKTMGCIETLHPKFEESQGILEAGSSRLKALIPSFKEKPASIGYLASADRFGFIDEIGKMVEAELNKHQGSTTNLLGEMNMLLEHKPRVVGSGNDNKVDIHATAKFLFVSNPISNRPTLPSIVGLIDNTTLGRGIQWVQNKEEVDFALSKKSIISPNTNTSLRVSLGEEEKEKKRDKCCDMLGGLCMCRGDFLTIFDSSNAFLSSIDDSKVQKLVDMSVDLAKEPMKSSVWKPRARHHITLMVDGACKLRCLFKDYDSSFTAKEEDYQLVAKLLERMVNAWKTDMSPKEDSR